MYGKPRRMNAWFLSSSISGGLNNALPCVCQCAVVYFVEDDAECYSLPIVDWHASWCVGRMLVPQCTLLGYGWHVRARLICEVECALQQSNDGIRFMVCGNVWETCMEDICGFDPCLTELMLLPLPPLAAYNRRACFFFYIYASVHCTTCACGISALRMWC